MRAAIVLLGLALCAGFAQAQTSDTHRHAFGDAERWARVFDDPARDAWQKPHEVIEALKLPADARIADLGAGTGYFSVRLANMLPKGRVYAVDISPDMVRYLERRARHEQLPNMLAVEGAPDDPRLPESVDLLLLVNVYHHIEDRARYFDRLSASLRPGGRVAIVDFTPDSPYGPPPETRIASGRVAAEMKQAGYTLAAEYAFLPHQYFLVFRPAR